MATSEPILFRQSNSNLLQENIRQFTLIRPPATFSLREKESTGTRLAKRGGCVAGASWSAAVPAAFGGRIRDCKKGNMDEQDNLGARWN